MIFKIYKIFNGIDNQVYVGCTKQALSKRFSNHRTYAKMCLPYKLYEHMNQVGIHRCFISLLESVDMPEDNMTAIRKIEQKWIDQLRPELNMNKAYVEKRKILRFPRSRHTTRMTCACGSKFFVDMEFRHRKTQRHQIWEEYQQLSNYVVIPYVPTEVKASDTTDNEIHSKNE